MSNDFPERDCNEVGTKISMNTHLSASFAAPSLQREFGIYGKYMNRDVRGSDEENSSLEIFGENFPQ